MRFSQEEKRDKLGKQMLARYYNDNMVLLRENGIDIRSLPQNLLNVILLNHPDMLRKKIDILAKYNFFRGSMQTTEVFQLINEALNKRNGEFAVALAKIKKHALKAGATTKQADALVEKFSSVVAEQDKTITALASQAVKAMKMSKKLGLHYAQFANKSRVVVTSVNAKTIKEIYDALGKNFFTTTNNKNKPVVDRKAIVTIMDKCSGLVTNCSASKIDEVASILKGYEAQLRDNDVTLDVNKIITRCPSILCSSNNATEIKEIIEFLLGNTTQSDKLHIKLSPKQLAQLLEADASILTIKPETLYDNMREIRANLRPLLTVQHGDKTVTDTKQLTEIVSNLFVGKNRAFIRNMDVNYTSQNDAILKKYIGENILAVYKYCPMLLTLKPAVLNNVMETLSTYPNAEQLKRLLVTTNMNASSSIAVNNFLFKSVSKGKKVDEVERVSTTTSKGAFQNPRIHYNDAYTPVENKTRIATTLYKSDRLLATSIVSMIREIAEIDQLAHNKTNDDEQFIKFVNGKLDEYEQQMQALIDDRSYYDQYISNHENMELLSQMNQVYTSILKDPDSIYTDKHLMDRARLILGDALFDGKDTFEQLTKLNADQKELITKHCNPGIVKLRHKEDDLRNDLVRMQMLRNMYQLLSSYVGPLAKAEDLQQIITEKGLDADATKLMGNSNKYIGFVQEHGTPRQQLAVRLGLAKQKAEKYVTTNSQEVDLGHVDALQYKVKSYADDIAQDFRKELNQNQK